MQNFGLTRDEATRIFDQSIDETSSKAPVSTGTSENFPEKPEAPAPVTTDELWKQIKAKVELSKQAKYGSPEHKAIKKEILALRAQLPEAIRREKGGFSGVIRDETPAPAPEKGAVSPAPRKPAKITPAIERRRDYFTPGNVVTSYFGQDKVLAYDEKPDGTWTATVRAVLPDGSPDPHDDRTRIHSTEPGKDSKVLSREAPQPTPVAPTVSAETPAAAVPEPESTIRVTPHKPNVNEGDGFKVTKGGQAVYLRPYWATGKFHVEEHGPTETVSNWPHPGTHEVRHTNKLTEPIEKDKALAYAKAYLQGGQKAAEATLPPAQPETPAPPPAPTPAPPKPLGPPSAERFNEISRELNELGRAPSSSANHDRRVDLEKELEHHRPAAEAAAQAEIDREKGKEPEPAPAAPLPANVEQEFAARHKDNLAAARKRGYVDADPEKVKKTLLTLTQQLNGGDSASASVGDRDVAIHRKKEWEGRGKKRTQVVSYTAFLTKPGKQTINYTARDPEAAVYWATEALHSLGVRPDFWDDYKYGAGNRSAERLVKTGDMLPNTESAMAASDAAAHAIGQPKLSGDIYSQAFEGGWKPGHAGMTFADIAKAYAENLPRNESALLDNRTKSSGYSHNQADPAYGLVQTKEPGKGYSSWENQVEDYDRAAKGHTDTLKNIRRQIETAKQLNGGTTDRIAESEKVFNDLEANIKKNLAFVKEQAKAETAKELVDTREKVRPLAEAYAKYGEATWGVQSSVAADPDSWMRRYAKLKGLSIDPLKQGGGEHQGQSGWAAVMKDLGIEPQKPPRRVEVPTTGKARLTNAEVAAIEKVQLGQDQIVPGDTGVMAKLAARGWLTDDYKLTPAGEAAVYSYRMDAEEAAQGHPIDKYVPKKQATIPGMGESRYGNEATAWNTVDGDIWHTEGHGAWKGEFPRNWAPRDVKKTGPNIAQVIAPGQKKGSVAPVKPIGFYTYAAKDATSQNVVFDNGAAMSAVNYDYTLHRNGGEVSWRQSDPKSAFFGYDKDGEIVAAVMPMKIEDVPAKLQQYLDPAKITAQERAKGRADDAAELKRLKKSLADRAGYEKRLKPGEEAAPGAAMPVGFTKAEAQARVAELEGKLGKGPQLSSRGPEESGPPKTVAELLPDATANRLRRRGAQLVDTLRVNQEAADVLGHAYELGGGERMGAFDGAALTPEHAKTTLEGLRPLFSQDSDLPSNAKLAAARIYGQLKKASGNGSRGVAIAMPGAESHEQLHFAVNQFKFDPDKVLEHGPTRVAVLEARSRGFVKSSDSDARVIREVMTRIWANEHGTLKINNETAVKIAADFLENATPETGALDTLEGLAHESHQTTIRDANQRRVDDGTESVRGEESGPSTRYRQEAGSPGGDRGTAPHPETGEGPELAKRVGFSDDEEGSAPADLLGLGKFVEDDVAPTLTKAATGIAEALDDGLKVLAPQFRSPEAQRAGLSLRHRAAELARSGDQARAALADAKGLFDKQPREDNYEFIRKMEAGEKQPTPELETISKTLRELFDSRRADVQALGTGKLRKFYENYFPHIWDNPKRAAQVFASLFGRRPIEGSKAFLKQRTHITFEDGLNAGLTPVSDNPVDLALLKTREVDRYIMAHRLLNEWKGQKLARFVDARNTEAQQGAKRAGWRQITDPIGTVYGPSVQQITEFPNEGLWNGLQAVAEALNLKQERGFLNLHGAVGRAHPTTGRVQTLHGTAEDVLAHEIGHQIDWLAGSGKRFVTEYPDPETVATLNAAYATLRDKGAAPSSRTAARKTIKGLHDAIGCWGSMERKTGLRLPDIYRAMELGQVGSKS